MKELNILDTVYLEEYDVHVKRYLTYDNIAEIVKQVNETNEWETRKLDADMMILLLATDIGADNVGTIPHDVFLASGLLDAVKGCIVNLSQVDEAIHYGYSFEHIVGELIGHQDEIKRLLELTKKTQ